MAPDFHQGDLVRGLFAEGGSLISVFDGLAVDFEDHIALTETGFIGHGVFFHGDDHRAFDLGGHLELLARGLVEITHTDTVQGVVRLVGGRRGVSQLVAGQFLDDAGCFGPAVEVRGGGRGLDTMRRNMEIFDKK